MTEIENIELDDILKEFRDFPDDTLDDEQLRTLVEEGIAAPYEPPTEEDVPQDTIRLDTISKIAPSCEPIAAETQTAQDEPAFTESWEPEYDQPMGEYTPPRPILVHPRSRIRELKQKLITGPEHAYYLLSEKGVWRLQIAIFLNMLVALLSAGATVLYAMEMVQPERMRLLIFGQFLAMLISGLFGVNQMIEGVEDLFNKRFTLNTMLAFTFLFCCIDGVLCLNQVRIPCCAAFSLEVTMSLWCAYQNRNTEIGQMDTLRKATYLNGVFVKPDYYEDNAGLLRGEAEPEDFMDCYTKSGKQSKTLSRYAMFSTAAALAIGIVAIVLHGIPTGFQVIAVSMLAAMPATVFITVSRPLAVLERRLHRLGVVLCGWRGVEQLSEKAVFPLDKNDFFPEGNIGLNGMKFYADWEPEKVIAYTTAVISADNGIATSLFTQLSESRNIPKLYATECKVYENGGLGGIVENHTILLGSFAFLQQMSVEIPENLKIKHSIYVAIDNVLSGLFAITYTPTKDALASISALGGCRKLNPILLCGDYLLTENFLKNHFGIKSKNLLRPAPHIRSQLRTQKTPTEGAAALITTEGLSPYAYAVVGARSLRTAANLGVLVHMLGGAVGLGIMLILTIIGATQLLTPFNMFLYQLTWAIPGLLITEWTRTL